MSSQANAIGVDVGGTKMVLGIVHSDGTISNEVRMPTAERAPDWVTERIVDYARETGPGLPVGVAVNAAVDPEGSLRYGTFIPWGGYPLRAELTRKLGVPVFAQNDGTVAAWGERLLDPLRRSVVVIAVGTGIGGGAVIEGKLLIGKGSAMEIGHLPGRFTSRQCVCGRVGCLEAIASGSAVASEYHARREHEGTPLANRVDAAAVVTAAKMGDEVALDVLKNAGSALGEAAALIVSILDPERIVLTGGLIHGAGDLLFEFAKASFASCVALPNAESKNILEKSTARVDPILLGAGSLAANLKQDST